MARGPAQAAEKQVGTENAVAGQLGATATGIGNNVIPFYENELSPEMTPSEQAGLNLTEGTTNANFDSARTSMEQGAARTHNDASLTAGEDDLARARGEQLSADTMGAEAGVQKRQQAGAQGLEGMYGPTLSGEESMYGLAPTTINAWNTASQHPLLQSLIGAAGGAASAALGKR